MAESTRNIEVVSDVRRSSGTEKVVARGLDRLKAQSARIKTFEVAPRLAVS
jgi:hypothetical protein